MSQLMQPTSPPSFANQQIWATPGVGGNSAVGVGQPAVFGASTSDFASWAGSPAANAAGGNPFGQVSHHCVSNYWGLLLIKQKERTTHAEHGCGLCSWSILFT